MKSSGLLPFVLLALGILAPWAVEGAENALKGGACPPRKIVQCLRYEKPKCTSDWQCPDKKKCCRDTCGIKCLNPVAITNPGEELEERMERGETKGTASRGSESGPAKLPPCQELLSQVCQGVRLPQTGIYHLAGEAVSLLRESVFQIIGIWSFR